MKKLTIIFAAVIIAQAAIIAYLAHYNKNLIIRNNNQYNRIVSLERVNAYD